MSDIPEVRWSVGWNREFEENVEELKKSGSFDQYKKQIIKVINNPIREGKYKAGSYKGLKTVHVSGSEQDIVCFELTPGVNSQRNIDKLEEVYFLHIAHWDNYDSALNSRQPADQGHQYDIQIPYFGGQYDPERVMSDIYDLAKDLEDCCVEEQNWEDEFLRMTGQVASDKREQLEEILPPDVNVEYEPPSPF
mgnify:CR=1 FL=1|jgi:hypothetical protein